MIFSDERDPEILGYLKQGFAYKEIASRIGVKSRTIETRLERMREKNDCKTNLQLMGKWVEEEKSTLVFRFLQQIVGKTQHNGTG